MVRLRGIKKIYKDGRHNAFTDMEYWKGYYYVAFRNGNGHARQGPPEVQGKIFIIRSKNLDEWELCARISTNGDDRDPSLLDLGDELAVFFATAFPKDRGEKIIYKGGFDPKPTFQQSYMAFTSDGITWSGPVPYDEEDYLLFQVERFGDECYGACYGCGERWGEIKLLHSTDGHAWETLSIIKPGSFPNETGIWINDDKKMLLVTREDTKDMSYLSESKPPYTDWHFKELNYTVHCPVFRKVGDELWVAGRGITEQLSGTVKIPPEPPPEKIASLARLDSRLAETPQGWYTAIWRMKGDYLKPVIVLPSRGDSGYPGLVVEKDRVLVSYYSKHDLDNGPKPRAGESANEIYLAEIER